MAPRLLTVLSLLLCAAAAGAAPAAKTAADYADVPAKLTAPPPHPPKVRLCPGGRCMLVARAAARSDTRRGLA
jgi:hypothetical protein